MKILGKSYEFVGSELTRKLLETYANLKIILGCFENRAPEF